MAEAVTNVGLKAHLGSLSYILMMGVLGVPIWWKTTEVYRAALPFEEIAALSSLQGVTHKVSVLLVTPDATPEGGHTRGPELQGHLLNSALFSVLLGARPPSPREAALLASAATLAEVDEAVGAGLEAGLPGSVVLLEAPGRLLDSPVVAGNHRTLYYAADTSTEELVATLMDMVLGEYQMTEVWRSRAAPFSRASSSDPLRKKTTGRLDVQLSLLVPEPEYVQAGWDVEGAVDRFIQPFLNRFPLQVTVSSQVLYLTNLHIPETREGEGPLEVSGKELGIALNKVESLLSSQSSNNPALNLIVYIPPIHRSPLTIRGSPSNSFLLPRWGGVHIYNYVAGEGAQDNFRYPASMELDMERVAGVWLGQLRSLMGVAEVGEGRALPVPAGGIRDWELDYQLRYRSIENIVETKSTLQSLSTLLSHISNIVITEDIARRVETSLDALKGALGHLEAGRLEQGHASSQLAVQQAEAAFFDPSLLALLYFPDDQKYAIYVPYFLPVGLPILLSVKAILRAVRAGKQKTD